MVSSNGVVPCVQLESLANVGTCRDCDPRRSLLLTNHPGRGFLGQQLGSGGADPSGAAADQGNFACNTHGLPRFGWLAVGGNYSRQSRYHRDRQVITLLGLIPHNCLRSQIGLRGQK